MTTSIRSIFTTPHRRERCAGLHQYDAQLEDFSRPSIDAEIAELKSFEQLIEAIVPDDSRASFVPRSDREIVLNNIRSQLLTLETIRPWQKNADNYSSTCANAAFVLMERKFAPPDDRLRSLVAREKQMPALLAAARVNLQNPPRIFTEIAIEQLPGHHRFLSARRAASLRRRRRSRAQS